MVTDKLVKRRYIRELATVTGPRVFGVILGRKYRVPHRAGAGARRVRECVGALLP